MKVGLVLGAGGVLGGAWLTGALHAIADETGWDPGSADRMVGTSAGAMIGALVAAGVPPWFMVAHSGGESFDGVYGADGRAASEADRDGGARYRLHRGVPRIGPGSWRLAAATLRDPRSFTALQAISGWLPQGVVSTEALEAQVRRAVPEGWCAHPSFWAMACDYDSGARVAFGRPGAPEADLARAVAASCAIPGFFRPVEIDGRRYIDGGMRSASNLDLLVSRGLDLVICLNPTSARHRRSYRNPLDAAWHATRLASGRRLGHEARKVRASGTHVVLLQPSEFDHELMGRNLMNGSRRHAVLERAMESVAEAIAAPGVRDLLADLPAGEPHKVRRPDGPPSDWPPLATAAQRAA